MLMEDIEFLGPVRVRDVEEKQQKIVQVIRKLDEAGEIIISRGGGQNALII
jgi:flagellar motor switch protein FliG